MAVVLAVTNDEHAGSTVALCPPRIELDDGGAYDASKAQRWLWQSWNEFWAQVDDVRNALGARLMWVNNGDAFDGDHHNTPQILSRNPEAQSAVAREVFAVPLALRPERIFVVRGTEVHVGRSGSGEEGMARRWRDDGLPVVGDSETGNASWWHLRADIEGVRIDVTHHGRTGFREHTRANAAAMHAHDILLSHVKRGDTPPDLCLRAHYHRFNDSYDACQVRVVTNAAWQLKTAFIHRIGPDSMADIGGCIVILDGGEYEVRKVHYTAERGPVWSE